jgi:AraC-like DNA-binding protein
MMTSVNATQPCFLNNLQAQIEQHIADDNLTVCKLVRILAMSRTNLHRKLVRSVGMSATEYIRYVRLHKAAALLLETRELSVYQVALEVGFNSQSYFTKRFREMFGVCPIAWREKRLEHL